MAARPLALDARVDILRTVIQRALPPRSVTRVLTPPHTQNSVHLRTLFSRPSRSALFGPLCSARSSRCALLGALFSVRSSRCALLGALFSVRSSRCALLGALFSVRSSRCALLG